MKTRTKWLLGTSLAIAGYTTGMLIRQAHIKEVALQRALSLSADKGIINLGAGYTRDQATANVCNLPQVKINVDITPANNPKCVTLDLEEAVLPYADKEFDVALASHVLEHIKNWQSALQEWIRVSDHQIIILPSPWFLGGRTSIHHVNYFSFQDMRNIMAQNPTVEIFC